MRGQIFAEHRHVVGPPGEKHEVLTAKAAEAFGGLGQGGAVVDHMLCNARQIAHVAVQAAKEGDIVLMSPASAAFDQFKNFMVRGAYFKKLIMEL